MTRLCIALLVAAGLMPALVTANEAKPPAADDALQMDGNSPARPLNGTLRLILPDGVGQSKRSDLRLELTCVDGKWRNAVYGRGLNRMVHYGQITQIKAGAEQTVLDIRMVIDSDAWTKGYTADYQITFRLQQRKAEGTYSYRADGQDYKGILRGHIEDFAEVQKNFVPPAPGEHPRLLFRRSEIPRLKELAQTAWGKALVERMKAIRPDDRSIADAPGDPYLPRGINAYGLANGLLYNLTGEQQYADNCRKALGAICESREGGNNMDEANRRLTASLTYDLAYEGLPAEFRKQTAGWIAGQIVWTLRATPKVTNIHPDTYLCGAVQDP